MKQKQFDTKNTKAAHSLSRFDLSNRTIFSAPFGMLVPCMVRHLVGGSKVQIELEHQIRVNSLNAPAFSRMRQHYDYFFVPYSQLYRPYDSFKTSQSNQSSALYQNKFRSVVRDLPYFNGQDMSWLLADWDDDESQIDDINGYDIRYGHRRLFDLLRYGNIPMSGFLGDYPYLTSQIHLNPFAALAYQKIYFDYYRNDYYEPNDSQYYNIDDFSGGSEIDVDRLRKIFTPHYRWRRKDYFTQVTPDILPSSNSFGRSGFSYNLIVQGELYLGDNNNVLSQFSVPGYSSVNSNTPVSNEIEDIPDSIDTPWRTNAGGANVQFTSNTNSTNSVTTIQQSVTQHRLANARQKLLERMYSTKSDFSSQMLAVYGYAPKEGRYGNVSHLGGFSDVIQIADVDNTTDDRATAVFGKINNVTNQSRKIKYEVPEDGVLMCIFSTDILQDYDSYRLDRFNFKHVPEDFFNPFYENLGKQALYSIEYAAISKDDENQDYVPTTPSVIGFVPRYSEYKTQIDEVHGEFCQWGTKNYMCAPTNLDYNLAHPYLYIRNLILKPSQIDPIMPIKYNGTEETDQFELNLYHSVKVLAPMSKMK